MAAFREIYFRVLARFFSLFVLIFKALLRIYEAFCPFFEFYFCEKGQIRKNHEHVGPVYSKILNPRTTVCFSVNKVTFKFLKSIELMLQPF